MRPAHPGDPLGSNDHHLHYLTAASRSGTFSLIWEGESAPPKLKRLILPRGKVSTYGRIARHLGKPTASRAVGRALATNPFPVLIPCHRAVRAPGDLGGLEMKRALLEMEGVEFRNHFQVALTSVYY